MQTQQETQLATVQKITPFLWFNDNAEEAAKLYTSLFNNSSINTVVRYSGEGAKASRMPEGSVMTIEFTLDGQKFSAINGGPVFPFTEAVSFVISCENQEEVDKFWYKLTADGGRESQCGWLKDRFGLSWQVVPKALIRLLKDKDPGRSQRAMKAMLQMKKIIIADLENAANSET